MEELALKIEELQVGQSFKNYKELCTVLGWEVKKSVGTKKAQFKELERYCNYTKIGHRIVIDEVFEKVKTKIDGRGKSEGNRKSSTIYGDIIQLLILDLLAQCKNGNLSISRSKLLLTISMINENYSKCGEQIKKLSRYTQIEEAIIYDFYNTSRSSFKGVIENAIKTLADKRIILCDIVTKVKVAKENTHRLATQEEKEFILKTEKSVLKELGYDKISEVKFSKDWKKFRRKTKVIFHAESMIDYHYAAYEIIINRDYLEEETKNILDFLLEETEREDFKEELNYKVRKNLNARAENRTETGFITSGKLYRSNPDYTDHIYTLTNLLISNSTKNIFNDVLYIEQNELSREQMDAIDDIFN